MHSVTIQPSGHQFQVEEGEAVLAAALRQGFVLPYGCKNGACGSCKGKIVAGTVDYGVYQAKALTDEEKALGKALFCQARPLTDLVIEARTIGAAKDIQVKTLPCRVQKMERVAEDVIILGLKLPANERLQFLAGQYLDILLSDGRRTTGVDTLQAAKMAADRGVRVHVVGLGTPDGHLAEGDGMAIYLQLDEPTLREVARMTGGEYYHAGTAEDLRSVYQTLGSRLQTRTRETELTGVLAMVAAILLVAGSALSVLWFHRGARPAVST